MSDVGNTDVLSEDSVLLIVEYTSLETKAKCGSSGNFTHFCVLNAKYLSLRKYCITHKMCVAFFSTTPIE
jgi:hypothetical protein